MREAAPSAPLVLGVAGMMSLAIVMGSGPEDPMASKEKMIRKSVAPVRELEGSPLLLGVGNGIPSLPQHRENPP